MGRGASAQRSGNGPPGGRVGAVEAGHRLPSTLESRDSHVPRQATHRRQAKPEKLQRAGRGGTGVGEGHQQDDRAGNACTAAAQLSETGALETAVLLWNCATRPFQLLEASHEGGIHPAEFGTPLVEGGRADAMLAAELWDG